MQIRLLAVFWTRGSGLFCLRACVVFITRTNSQNVLLLFQVMSLLAPRTIPLFHFTGDKATTPICPIDMQPNLNPSSGAQSYQYAGADCKRSAKYNLPFFLENLGPRFSEWSVNAHEARPGHHTQVNVLLSLLSSISKDECTEINKIVFCNAFLYFSIPDRFTSNVKSTIYSM